MDIVDIIDIVDIVDKYYAVASHYYKKLFCENSDVHGFL